MGALIPNPHDLNVRNKLDVKFSDPHLRNLRNRIGAAEPDFFSDPGHPRHLARISHRLNIAPDGPPPPGPGTLKGRWQYFLQVLLTDPVTAAQNGTTVAEVVRKALGVFVKDDPRCTSITFDVVPDDGTLPAGRNYHAVINPDPYALPAAPYVASITLMCRVEIPPGVSANDPAPDGGEVPPDQPNI
jgi:hypothetical protein